jgi:hypothetical protein
MVARYSNKRADNFRLAKSQLIVSPSNGRLELIRIPHKAFVKVFLQKIAAAAAGTITVGFIGNRESEAADFFLDNTEAAGGTLGIVGSTDYKYFESGSGAITVTTASNFDGSFYVLAEYTTIH